MDHTSHEPAKYLRPLQFSLRWVIVATALMAIAFALLAPWLRQFPSRRVAEVIGAWCLAILLFWLMTARSSLQFTRSCQEAGDIWCEIPRSGTKKVTALFALTGVVLVLMAVVFTQIYLQVPSKIITAVFPQGLRYLLLLMLLINLVVAAMHVHTFLLQFLWVRRVLLAENGIVDRLRFVPWSDVLCHQWHWLDGQLWILKVPKHGQPLKLDVRDADRAAVEEVLSQVRAKYHGAG